MLYSLSKEELLDVFISVGNQLSFLWNVFLKFHRCDNMYLSVSICQKKIFQSPSNIFLLDMLLPFNVGVLPNDGTYSS